MGLSCEYAIAAQLLYHYGLFVLKKIKHPDLKYNSEYTKVTLLSICITILIYCSNTGYLAYVDEPFAACGFGINCLKGTHFLVDYLGED